MDKKRKQKIKKRTKERWKGIKNAKVKMNQPVGKLVGWVAGELVS
jgi:hypothetical protein